MLFRVLDMLALLSAMLAAWLWYHASSNHVRRVDKDEELDHQDLNRIIVAMNRSQVLNRRAALATAASALAIALKFGVELIARL
jgi:hypothetical protein